MSHRNIIRAWKDPKYLLSLSEWEQELAVVRPLIPSMSIPPKQQKGDDKILRRYVVSFIVIALFIFTGWPPSAWAEDEEPSVLAATPDGRLSLQAKEAPLAGLLQAVARELSFKIYGEARLEKKKMTIAFTDLPVQEGLERILSGYNVAFIFSSETVKEARSHRRLQEVWVLPRPSSKSTEPTREERVENPAGNPPDPNAVSIADRRRMVKALGQSRDQKIIPVLLDFFNDPDRTVRFAVVDALINLGSLVPADSLAEIALNHEDPPTRMAALTSGLPFPRETLVEHALHDPSAPVRVEALQVLGADPEIESVAKEALTDPDPSVQAMAKHILKKLEEEAVSPAEEQVDEEPAGLPPLQENEKENE